MILNHGFRLQLDQMKKAEVLLLEYMCKPALVNKIPMSVKFQLLQNQSQAGYHTNITIFLHVRILNK